MERPKGTELDPTKENNSQLHKRGKRNANAHQTAPQKGGENKPKKEEHRPLVGNVSVGSFRNAVNEAEAAEAVGTMPSNQ